MSYHHPCLTNDALERLLHEDAPYGDLTVHTLDIAKQPGKLTFHVRDPMVVCAIEEAARLFELSGAEVQLHANSGMRAEVGTALLTATGQARALFQAWKVAQSLVEATSGVSTLARHMVDKAGTATIACTRKHLPGIKPLMVKAVQAGGATMHRLGLSETVMVTAEHRAFFDKTKRDDYLAELQNRLPEKKCIVEVETVDAALRVIEQGCDVIQLEKQTPENVALVVAAARSAQQTKGQSPVIAAGGGINLDNVATYAATGVQVLVTSAPYFAKPRDVQVRLSPSAA